MTIIADLSKYQGTVDFAKLSKVVAGVILRVQAGSSNADPKYKEYVAGCKQYKIPFGTYAYFKGISVNDAIQEAKDAFTRMDKVSVCFALDIEEVTCSNLVAAGQSFIDYLHQQGVKNVGLYSGESFFKTHNLASIKADWHWIANYGTNNGKQNNKPGIPCDLWQFTSVGNLDGITGNVDVSVPVGSKAIGYFVSKPATQAPKPAVQAKLTMQTKPEITQSAKQATKPVSKPANNAVMWNGAELRKGQIGKLTILKPINLWKDGKDGKLEMVKVLKPNAVYRVYGYRNDHGGQYGLGGGLYITKIAGYIKYETPSKALLEKVK